MTKNDMWTLGVAIYAAVVASAAVGWDFYKWRSTGPKLTMRVSTGMATKGVPDYDGRSLISVTVSNRGDGTTTITGLGFEVYKSRLARLFRRRAVESGIVIRPNTMQPWPFQIEPGQQWIGMMDQDALLEEHLRTQFVEFIVFHSHSDAGIRMHATMKD